MHSRLVYKLSSKIYYGWVMVALLFLSNIVVFSFLPTLSLYVVALEEEAGWPRSITLSGFSIAIFLGFFASTFLGRLADKYGLKALFLGLTFAGSLLVLIIPFSNNAWVFCLLYAVFYAIISNGAGFLCCSVGVINWFVRNRGKAMATVMIGASLGGAILVPLQGWIIDNYGWQVSFSSHIIPLILLGILPAAFLMVNKPADIGLEDNPELKAADTTRTAEHFQLKQALRTPIFWVILIGVMLDHAAITGYFSANVPFIVDKGFSIATAGGIWSAYFFGSMLGKFPWGILIDKIPIRTGFILFNVGEILGVALMIFATEVWQMYIVIFVHGLLHAPWLAISTQIWGDYFGQENVGAIYGFAQPLFMAPAAVVIILGGVLYSSIGSYQMFYYSIVLMLAVSLLSFIILPKPNK